MNLNKLKIFAFCAGICVLLSGCETASPEVTDPPQKQASAIKSQGGVYKVGNPYKILGRWYYPKEDYSYSEVGIASWYGPDFHAKRTANGEKYNMHSLTAAPRTLPLPSIVKITNLENGRSLYGLTTADRTRATGLLTFPKRWRSCSAFWRRERQRSGWKCWKRKVKT